MAEITPEDMVVEVMMETVVGVGDTMDTAKAKFVVVLCCLMAVAWAMPAAELSQAIETPKNRAVLLVRAEDDGGDDLVGAETAQFGDFGGGFEVDISGGFGGDFGGGYGGYGDGYGGYGDYGGGYGGYGDYYPRHHHHHRRW
ncbi:uncharacterized protein LOC128278973 [Anopheles cruzii]|uniref:uncharacterized protein LOC128278973 n=1 Tax=Anopheles cruzii TaxID=68878 RepID=UPI0022EC39C4|nr:uncharacterized protein LOC128278973 [Anopheles cruzii]